MFCAVVGDFSLALWDTRLKVLHLVRDHAGTCPLIFVRDEKQLRGPPSLQHCSTCLLLILRLKMNMLQAIWLERQNPA